MSLKTGFQHASWKLSHWTQMEHAQSHMARPWLIQSWPLLREDAAGACEFLQSAHLLGKVWHKDGRGGWAVESGTPCLEAPMW